MIRIFQDKEAMSLGAADLFVRCAGEALERRGMFCVALSGGGTPRRTYELLALPPHRDRVDWERTDVFWGDERCVPTGDDRSNATMARETLLSRVPVPPERIRPIHCHENPAQGARQYENLLKRHFGDGPVCFDLIFLGLGENGHTASLFPETPALEEKEKLVSEVRVAGEDFCRVTLTAPAINRAATVAVLVSGISKASVLRDVLEGPRDPDRLPAQLIHPLGGQMLWLIDREAASCLERVS